MALIGINGMAFAYRSGLRRRRNPVFEDFSWTVESGRRTVLLGVNGAGKSTLLRLMAGILRPSEGVVETAGDHSLDSAVAMMAQDITALRGVTALEQVAYAGWLAGLPRAVSVARARACLATVRLSDQGSQPSGELSGGQLRRLGLAETLIRDSPVLLLDEPTAGLDPAQRQFFREILTSAELDRRTVVVSTHQIDDLDQAFEDVAVLSRGRLVFHGSVSAFLDLDEQRSAERAFASLVDGGHH